MRTNEIEAQIDVLKGLVRVRATGGIAALIAVSAMAVVAFGLMYMLLT